MNSLRSCRSSADSRPATRSRGPSCAVARLIVYLWLQAGWSELSSAERQEVRKLLTKSRGRPRNLNKAEAKRLGQLAGRAASAAARIKRR